ncbi:type II toxin-antitoxin system HicA family toxin [Streptomyces sp. NPDC057611]|uniref:type II toxin-antitoxin system HicA family toxin n=1 Tax=Streptomyces sp. NPDC057611 TaxID=3346182 RepID=UPI0036B62BEC
MKKSDLIKVLSEVAANHGAELRLIRQGARHEIYLINSTRLVVPRHKEVVEGTARAIIKDAEGA